MNSAAIAQFGDWGAEWSGQGAPGKAGGEGVEAAVTSRGRPDPAATVPGADDLLGATIAAMAGGDEKAFERLYDATVARVFALARRICVDPALAEEVTEDVYVQAWREASRFDASRGVPLAWLLMMARSRALDARRRLDPAQSHPEPQSLQGDADARQDGRDASDPLDLLETLRRESRTRAALATLPAGDRQMVALAFLRGLTHAEIAAATRQPLGTVKTAIRRALLALRTPLQDYAPAARGGLPEDEVGHDS